MNVQYNGFIVIASELEKLPKVNGNAQVVENYQQEITFNIIIM